jgi:hypothetical protein
MRETIGRRRAAAKESAFMTVSLAGAGGKAIRMRGGKGRTKHPRAPQGRGRAGDGGFKCLPGKGL